jgi:DNA-binding transcriptional ArsR family regulator
MTNISAIDDLARVFQSIGQPARLQILLAIGSRETCVCHLEAVFGWRQAYLSQHLMALRRSGLLEARRAGRFIHYRLIHPEVLEIVRRAADLQGVKLPDLEPSLDCGCSNCRQERGEQALPACGEARVDL